MVPARTGPVTPEGKARAAANSVRHGLCSSRFELDDAEDRAAFQVLLEGVVAEHGAVGAPQEELCRHLAVAMWRRRVCDNLEMALMQAIARGEACAETGGDGLPSLRTLLRYRTRLDRDLDAARTRLAELQAAARAAAAGPKPCRAVARPADAPAPAAANPAQHKRTRDGT